MSGKKLLILAGAGVHSKVVDAARAMGVYTVVTDYLDDSPAKRIADEALKYDIFDVEALVEFCRQNRIDGVLDFCIDPAQRPAREIAERCGLPCFASAEQMVALTDKSAFKALCRRCGVDVIPEYTVADVERGGVEFPVLVKPADSRGSRGITVCRSQAEVLAAVEFARKEAASGKVIIEKYMEKNQDLTITYVVKNGEAVLVSLGDRNSGREEDNLNRQLICTIQPSRYEKMYMEHVNDRVIGMIKTLGIKNGPVFMQGFVDGNTVRMYDPGVRFPGNEYERIVAAATGVNLMKSMISYCIGDGVSDFESMPGVHLLNGKRAIQYIINVGPGRIGRFDGLAEIAGHPLVIDIQQRHFPGAVIENTGDIRHRAGEVSVLVDDDPQKMCEAIRFIQQHLVITDENGRDMIISPFEAERVLDLY